MKHDRITLTAEHALTLIAFDGHGNAHTFRQSIPNVLIGADWERQEIEDVLRTHTPEFGGAACRASHHGIVVIDKHGPVFIATKPDIDWEQEEAEALFVKENPQ